MTKEQKDNIISLMLEERNHYAEDCQRRIAKEYGRIEGADYMLQRLLDFLKESTDEKD